MNPTSVPVVPPQPDLANFSTSALALFQTYTRDSYLAAFGVQAPAWDASLLSKFWFDSTVDVSSPSSSAAYTVVNTATASLQPLSLAASEAAAVNLPGVFVYPPHVVAPTDATRGGAAMNPVWFSLLADATALMTLLNGSGLVDAGDTVLDPVVYPADELRRMWQFTLGGMPLNAGMLLASQNAEGVGAPGQWDLSTGSPQWVPAPAAPTGLDDTRLPQPMPVRALLPNEQLVASPLGLGGATVVRTDIAAQQGGGYTIADRALMQQIYNLVAKLAG